MTFDPVARASRGARSFQYDELSPPPASSTSAGSFPSVTWKTTSCSAFVTLRVVVAGALGAVDDVLLAASGVEHAASETASRIAEGTRNFLRRNGFV
ncbi:hypothetical protein GCM10017774_30330 [Lentzea cavernae]|uniref:Uncharacterized protein n=1 Tax=Lentzea cavernae TaxID=2020703 RepID=A0ABQ3MEY4_9PSEU|nr:hypothetical protein GCM10017774_30330 [Lentzea cavernae]